MTVVTTRGGMGMGSCVAAIGAANIDLLGFTDKTLRMRDSNPGRIESCLGGVARNISENLVRLGISTNLITAIGDDAGGTQIRESCRQLGIDLTCSLEVADHPSSTYMAMMDEQGDMALALSDMRILDRLKVDHLKTCEPLLEKAAVIVADAGLTTETMAWLVGRWPEKRIYLDPVSIGKCRRMEMLTGQFHCIKMNRLEAGYLAGMTISGKTDLEEASRRLLNKGVKKLFITLGEQGVYYADEALQGMTPAIPLQPVNATGAGDAFTAAVVYGDLQGWSMAATARFAVRASAVALLSRHTVSEDMSVETVNALKDKLTTKAT
ncbi:carbohydrate kinase family protein [Anoxynatronum sibiricum]